MREFGQPLTSFTSISVSQACGLTLLSLAVSMSEAMIAQFDPPPLKWSSLMYGLSPELEDHDAEEETQAGRDRREVAAS
jgi:hypothetical protein